METDIKNDGNMPVDFTVLNFNTVTITIRFNQTGNNHLNGNYAIVAYN